MKKTTIVFQYLLCLSIVLVGLCLFLQQIFPAHADNNGYYIPVSTTPGSSSSMTIQLNTIHFIFITYTPTPSDVAGTSGGSKGDQIASLATSMANSLRANCQGYVNFSKVACVNGVGSSDAVAQLKLNLTEDYSLQCAGFVQAVAIGVGSPIGNGDAATYAGKNIAGYSWIPNTANAPISIGDIPVWTGAGCEHVAIVTQTFGTSAFRVAEANGSAGIYGPAGSVVFENYGKGGFASCSLRGWQHPV